MWSKETPSSLQVQEMFIYLKNNYGPISILPNLSKLFERLLRKHLPDFLKVFYQNSNMVSGKVVRNIAHYWCLEPGKKTTDNNKAFGELLTDLSNAFDCPNHCLLIKLHTHGLDLTSMNTLQDYIANRR